MDIERHLRNLQISADLNSVSIIFDEVKILPVPDGADPEVTNEIRTDTYTVVSENRPHKNLVDAVKKLVKHGLAIMGITLEDNKQIKNWIFLGLKIDGDPTKQQSRATITLGVRSELTGKISKLACSQVTMYPKDDEKVKYQDAGKLTTAIEDASAEVWEYAAGKCEDENMPNTQLALFTLNQQVEAQ
jgi:hypothetical protein